MTTQPSKQRRSKRLGAIAVGLFGMAAAYFAFGLGGESHKKSANASAPVSPTGTSLKPVQTMNLALGDMVVLARDLGFSIATEKNTSVESNKVLLRIESHLQRLREIYRQESGKNSTLSGSVLVQFKISQSGEVSDVTELSSRITDAEFKAAVLSEVSRWSFADVLFEPLTVTCPLLFVREGMDITTLVRWEKSFANSTEKATPTSTTLASSAPTPIEKKAPPVKPSGGEFERGKTPAKNVEIAAHQLQVRYSTSLRKRADFSADSLTVIGAGTKVTVLGKTGDWLEVRLSSKGPSGFIRKEFVKAVEVAGE